MLARLRISPMSYLTITHAGCSSGNAMRPTTAVTAMSSGLFTFQRNRTASDATAMRAVSQSPMAICSEQDAGAQDRSDRGAIGTPYEALDIGIASVTRQKRGGHQHEDEGREKDSDR